jgi:hypothetical protein
MWEFIFMSIGFGWHGLTNFESLTTINGPNLCHNIIKYNQLMVIIFWGWINTNLQNFKYKDLNVKMVLVLGCKEIN